MNTPPTSIEAPLHATHQLSLLQKLRQAATERARLTAQITASWQTRVTRAETESQQAREQIEREANQALGSAKREFQQTLAAAEQRWEQGSAQFARRQRTESARLAQEQAEAAAAADRERNQRLRKIQETCDSRTHQFDTEALVIQERLAAHQQQADAVAAEAGQLLRRRGSAVELADATRTVAAEPPVANWDQLAASIRAGQEAVLGLSRLPAARFIDEGWPVLCAIAGSLAAIYPSGVVLGWSNLAWPLGSLGAGVVSGILARFTGRRLARRELEREMPSVRAELARLGQLLRRQREQSDRELQAKRDQLKNWRVEEQRRTAQLHATASGELAEQQARRQAELDEALARDTAELQQACRLETERAQAHYPPVLEQLEQQLARQLQEIAATRDEQLREAAQRRDKDLERTEASWRSVLEDFEGQIAAMTAYRDEHFPPWNEFSAESWEPPAEPLSALPFGRYTVRLSQLVAANLRREEQAEGSYELPAVLTVPDRPSLLLEIGDQGRAEAAQVMQDVMLRWLTAAPAGKVRFTIIDPVGLGQDFSSFMHLADYDERLVNSRIWTEQDHIRQRLADLTEHMENVIQKYLRNEYRSIQEYNQVAGEVAEPIHILVVANFPEAFGDEAARRLASIAASGARCGVYLLASIDSRLKLPRDFYLNELEEHAATLVWSSSGFVWKHADLQRWPLQVAAPPTAEQATAVIHAAGRQALGANRVEVPFRTVAPADEAWWTHDSRRELAVPLGRLGATKQQLLRLGRGTSQHVLVAGKTGSGKSTLFHALITNLALHYSPAEVELYLVDFKKGVEFKAYAEHRLPHARVIAIESEREFGLSVLERLDEELKVRGELFRKCGAQDVAGYRAVQPDAELPRIVLVIDEFQEFFVKEDRISRDAALLLDRLVRQGRAFGIHVLLGSQTLAGAYSLARSTLGQMAVRIALQCGETDAHLILSEDNTAARLLSRPGEAIYNDANGLLEGNHLFQVVWLPDRERAEYLQRLAQAAAERRLDLPPPVIFEGNEPADLATNAALQQTLRDPSARRPFGAWLGAAVAIKPPTFVEFERQNGTNALLVGQDQELARGILAAAAVGLAATGRSQGWSTCFQVLTPGEVEAIPRAWWESLSQLGAQVQIGGPAQAQELLAAACAEMQRRLEQPAAAAAPWVICIENLARFRDLRREDDDLSFGSFSSSAEPSVSAAKLLGRLLRDGPSVGLHTIVACDSYTTFSRWLERAALRNFALRVLLQMSPTDSSHFMDSPAANQLGGCRGWLYREDRGEAEKFRPYRLTTVTE